MSDPREEASDPREEARSPREGRLDRLPDRLSLEGRIAHGVISGVLGAAVVAILFLVRDLVAGQPLWTPHALGSALFLRAAPAASPSVVLVLGYTIAHGAIFVALGLLAATLVPMIPRAGVAMRGALAALGLFALLEVTFALFTVLFAPDAASLQPRWVAGANLVAALAMATYLLAARGSLEHSGTPEMSWHPR
jgi:hypothetical protein